MNFRFQALRNLTPDGWLLFATRFIRLFAYGLLAVILFLYLSQLGYSDSHIGLLLSFTLIGDTAISLWLTTRADRLGRRKMLLVGALLMVMAGILFALTHNYALLIIAATVGVISPSGNEVGPFLSIEQAALAHVISDQDRTATFAWYTLAGSMAAALGSLAGGGFAQFLQHAGISPLASYRAIVILYALLGILLLILFLLLSRGVEVIYPSQAQAQTSGASPNVLLGLHRSRGVVFRLSGLFALDAFGGGFVIQSIAAYWFHKRFGADPATLGAIFFGANLLAAFSALAAASLARRFGLINTMVFTHRPSNVLLILVPLMPSLQLAIILLFLRFSISQMDVPTRQSYTMAVVSPDERSAAAGVTNVVRTTGAAIAPLFAGRLLGNPALMNLPFFLAGGLKIIYDLLLYRSFIRIKPSEEQD